MKVWATMSTEWVSTDQEFQQFLDVLNRHPEVALPIIQFSQVSEQELKDRFTVLYNQLVEAKWELSRRGEVWDEDALGDFMEGRI